MTMQMRKQISTLEADQQELFMKNERAMEELRRANAALKQENDALKRSQSCNRAETDHTQCHEAP